MPFKPLTILALVLATLVAITAHAQAPTTGTPSSPSTSSQSPPKPLDVPYVPTDEKIVAQMLKMAKVKKGDVLYDLGCGDGRIVITAAKKFGVRGVGVDIDPERIREANENARRAGVTDRVKFLEQDLFETDIREATVVTLYLLPDVNMRLRPKLLSDLKPGTRIVSHNYDMGDWTPEKRVDMQVAGTTHTVYFWTVPKRAAGAR
jgi:SAM-dependent methyltransferase